jgi:hypothetical protein
LFGPYNKLPLGRGLETIHAQQIVRLNFLSKHGSASIRIAYDKKLHKRMVIKIFDKKHNYTLEKLAY